MNLSRRELECGLGSLAATTALPGFVTFAHKDPDRITRNLEAARIKVRVAP